MTDQPDTVQHVGDVWLTLDDDGFLGCWSDELIQLSETRWSGLPAMTGYGWMRPLADPDQPVRVRLELRAVRVEEESDGE